MRPSQHVQGDGTEITEVAKTELEGCLGRLQAVFLQASTFRECNNLAIDLSLRIVDLRKNALSTLDAATAIERCGAKHQQRRPDSILKDLRLPRGTSGAIRVRREAHTNESARRIAKDHLLLRVGGAGTIDSLLGPTHDQAPTGEVLEAPTPSRAKPVTAAYATLCTT